MAQSPLQRLDQHLKTSSTPIGVWGLGIITGIQLPFQILLLSLCLAVLEKANQAPASLTLGRWVSLSASWIGADVSPLRGVLALLFLAFLASLVQSMALWGLYQMASSHTLEKVMQLYREIFRKSGQLALAKSISGQQSSLRDATERALPTVSLAWEAWLRTMPRYFVQGILCIALALLIHPLITLLSAVGIGLLSQMYRLLEQRTRTQVPVLRERAAGLNRRIRELCETGPLLDFVHAGEAAAESLETQLRSLKQAESAMIMTRSWKTPLMAFAIAMVACLVGFVLSVRILTPDSQVTISAAFALCASLAATTFAFLRIERAWVAQTEGRQAAQVLLTMFEQPELPVQNNLITLVDRFTDQLKLEHVTLQDSEGRKLLSDVSIHMKPGQLVAIVGNRRLQAKALAELILGFGRPTSGRMLIDQTNTIDIDPQAFRSQCAWIAPDGPLVPGTIEDNLHANGRPASMAELMDALRLAGTYEAIQNLPDGLATMVTPHDDRLSPDHLFRLGIARALTKKPMLVVAEEPSAPVSQQQEAGTLAALRQMTSRGVLVVTLPERLSTLRDADMIVVLNDHQVDSIGKHNQLLQTSELYRHLNYLRFSELRGVSLQ